MSWSIHLVQADEPQDISGDARDRVAACGKVIKRSIVRYSGEEVDICKKCLAAAKPEPKYSGYLIPGEESLHNGDAA